MAGLQNAAGAVMSTVAVKTVTSVGASVSVVSFFRLARHNQARLPNLHRQGAWHAACTLDRQGSGGRLPARGSADGVGAVGGVGGCPSASAPPNRMQGSIVVLLRTGANPFGPEFVGG